MGPIIFITIVAFVLCGFEYVDARLFAIDPEVDMTLEERIRHHGYPVETHKIITKDNYVLSAYHIPHGKRGPMKRNSTQKPIMFIHGMGGTPKLFILLKDLAVPYFFAERGYDVWIFAARGFDHIFKEKHLKLSVDDPEFWLFSCHEIAIYDLPATIDHILDYSKQDKINLVGHSAGGNFIYMMLSEQPEFNEKVNVFISYASSPLLKRVNSSLVLFLNSIIDILKGITKYLNLTDAFPFLASLKPFFKLFCVDSEFCKVCKYAGWIIGGHRSYFLQDKDVQLLASVINRISFNEVFHFMDNINYGELRKFNYGTRENLRIYNQTIPPLYNFSRATAPGAFFLAQNDGFIILEDIYEAMEQIPNTVKIYTVPYERYNHADFLVAKNSTEWVFEPTYRLIEEIENGFIPPPIKPPHKYGDRNLGTF